MIYLSHIKILRCFEYRLVIIISQEKSEIELLKKVDNQKSCDHKANKI